MVSLSLGGECISYEECEEDAIVAMCEKLIAAGISVVAAAGNSACDSCLQTPSFAPNVVTVGASDENDIAALFSDYGKCIDLYAPGVRINSACADRLCESHSKYMVMSGTSMAAPHAAGVAAIVFQVTHLSPRNNKHPNTFINLLQMASTSKPTPEQVAKTILCSAAKMKLSFDGVDPTKRQALDMTRNLLLQVPTRYSEEPCELGLGCEPSKCSGASNLLLF